MAAGMEKLPGHVATGPVGAVLGSPCKLYPVLLVALVVLVPHTDVVLVFVGKVELSNHFLGHISVSSFGELSVQVEEGTNAREIRGSDVELGGEFPLVLGGLVLKSVFSSNVPALDVKSLTGGLKCELVICESGTHLPAVLVAGNGAAALLGLNSAPVVSVFSLCILCSFPFVLPCLLMADGAAFACVSGHGNDLVLGWLISWVHVLVKETIG